MPTLSEDEARQSKAEGGLMKISFDAGLSTERNVHRRGTDRTAEGAERRGVHD
ncbi:MAG: hypothetical protein WC822_07365 [Candidatus Paceibacterota bacterium]